MATRALIPVEVYLTSVYRPGCDYVDGEVASHSGDLRRVTDMLRTENPLLEVPLAEIFE